MIGHRCEGAGGLFGEGIVGHAVLFENLNARRHIDRAHERTDHGLAAGLGDRRDDRGGRNNIGHGLRGQQDNRAIDPIIFEHTFERGGVAIMAGVPDDVDRIVKAGRIGQGAAHFFFGGLGELSNFEIMADGCVGGHDARAPRIGDDSDAIAFQWRLLGKGGGVVKEFANAHRRG